MKDGSLMSWGNNDHGQLGRLSDYYAKPVSVVLSITVLTITTGGYHTMLISTYNYVYGFGSNSMFQLGAASDKRYSDRLVFVDSIVGATFIATGQEHTLCVANKTVFAWGSNLSGQLGFSKYQVGVAPQEIKSFLDIPIKHVAAGHQHSLALSHQGDVYAWGSGMFGAVGDNEATDIIRPTPKLVALGTFTTRIAAAGRHSMALSSDGTIYTWGLNIAGQLGDGTTTNRYRSVRVTPVCSQERSYYDFIAAGASNIMGVVSGGASVHTSGTNSHWQLGIGRLLVTNQQSSPVIVRDIKEKIIAVAMSGVASYEYYPNPLDIGAGYAVTNKGSVYAWGSNEFGLLGEEQVPEIKLSTTTQVNIGVGHNVTQISAYGSFVVTLANCAPGYSGDNCDVFECFGISSTSKSACSGNGTCVAPDTCNCGYYKGRNCETWTCGYMNHSDSSVCKGHGKCISIDTCLCEKSYTGSPYCDPVCFGKNFEESCNRDNGANNTCIAPNTCECRDGFGLECKLPLWVLITIILGGIIIFCIVMVPTTSAIAFFSIKRRQKKKRISEMNMFLLGDDTKEMLSLENMIQYDDLEFKEKM
jgi:alpha-tubulin suppressor-like RCC1 family protein